MRALEGIKVLDLSRLFPGPYCSMILADLGAEVLCVEDRRFADEGPGMPTIMRNKRHMTLNLKHPEGREIFCPGRERGCPSRKGSGPASPSASGLITAG